MKINFKDPKLSLSVQLLFRAIKNKEPSADTLRETVRQVTDKVRDNFIDMGMLPSALRNPDVYESFLDELHELYKEHEGVRMPVGQMISDKGFEPWIEAAVKAGTLLFDGYEKYRMRLMESGFNEESLRSIDTISDDVLDHMGNPKSDHAFKTFGLLMGDVQSGKTATFTGITHKAVDAGYRLIVVLTGTKSSLRTQTQNRLNEDLIGQAENSKGERTLTLNNGRVLWNPLTSPKNDFTKDKTDASITPDNPNQVSIAVMQKNGHVLTNFSKWLDNTESLGVKNLPLLFVDDEADQASINVNRDGEDPTKINGLIREILDKFDRSAYLAVTATPFANVFIDPRFHDDGSPHQDELPDLFPKDYIYAIPAPKGYLGVERLFGELGEVEKNSFKYRSVISMTPVVDGEPDDVEEKTYAGRFKAHDEVDRLPESLRRAVLYFLCVLTLKDLKYISKSNTSMMVHIARFSKVQKDLRVLIEEFVRDVLTYAEAENGRITEASRSNPIFRDLESLWNEGCREELWYDDPTHGEEPPSPKAITGHAWNEVWKSRFRNAIRDVKVIEVNMNSKVKNFEAFYENDDAKLIAVGGDALARGLTLEGLCVSYFARRSFTYDTLLQMGRWFGYREGMRDYMKLWISDKLVEGFGYIAEALGEFRDMIGEMKMRGMTPSQFGLKIRVAPQNVELMVTAANKRRSAKRCKVIVDFTGKRLQASTFTKDAKERLENRERISAFLKSLGPQSTTYGRAAAHDESSGARDLVWEGVPAAEVAQLISSFHCPVWSDKLDIYPVTQKIRERNENWMVRVVALGEEEGKKFEDDVFGLGPKNRIVCPTRTIVVLRDRMQQPNRSITGSTDFGRHLTPAQKKELLERVCQEAGEEIRSLSSVHVLSQPDQPPQLLIYAIRPVTNHSEEKLQKFREEGTTIWREPETLVTLAFALPGTGDMSKDRTSITYEANPVYVRYGAGRGEGEDR